MFAEANLWLLKPNNCNRGKGVILFNKIEEVKKMVQENLDGNRLQ